MRIVLVMVEPPLPFGNAAGRWYYVLLRGLVERGHQVTALATYLCPQDAAEALQLFPAPQYDLKCFPIDTRSNISKRMRSLARPLSYLFSDSFQEAFSAEVARGYDVIHMEHLWTAWLTPDSWQRTVVNLHYLFSIDWRDARVRFVDQRILRAEDKLLRRLSNIAALSPRLSAAAHEKNPLARTFTIPLGLDLSLYPFDRRGKTDGPPTVGIIGSFNWTPSRAAGARLLHQLWPRIKYLVPAARLLIVGRSAASAFPEAQAMADVTVESDVPDAQPYFRKLDVLLYAPSVGSGMKVKILESFALGTAVVTNEEGVEGIAAIDGEHCGVARGDDGLVERAVELLVDPERRRARRIAARMLLEEHCRPSVVLDQVEAVHRIVAVQDRLNLPENPAA